MCLYWYCSYISYCSTKYVRTEINVFRADPIEIHADILKYAADIKDIKREGQASLVNQPYYLCSDCSSASDILFHKPHHSANLSVAASPFGFVVVVVSSQVKRSSPPCFC